MNLMALRTTCGEVTCDEVSDELTCDELSGDEQARRETSVVNKFAMVQLDL